MAFESVYLSPTGADAYGVSPWSAHCRALRNADRDFTLKNYATFWYTLSGYPGAFQHNAVSNRVHSEKEVWEHLYGIKGFNRFDLKSYGTKGSQTPRATADEVAATGTKILCVYTEREPCNSCSPFLDEVLPNGTRVYWHFPYSSIETSKYTHSAEIVARNVLLMLPTSDRQQPAYAAFTQENQRAGRVEGNTALKTF